ncbi:DUF3072 domain-containing protein [Nocardioides sp. CFH 31398]|uniref:DUF3072 domain-containing protein n=1 Tax=Nocardioides sp. CFH 31398 TaxID=2919579 RepID=UPI001F069B1D|nr:DUF3072 domain-containing protein [Nocardioides sp. CFH 31398]MCH1866884.1 DUF3072 domain-containing protein [Nocardioides sp. CFH 31398]
MTDSNTDSTASDTGTQDGAADNDTAIGESGGMLGATGTDAANTTEKDPSEWVTGDEPATGAQKSYLDTLAREAGETLSADLTKAEASEHIERLQAASGRGQG